MIEYLSCMYTVNTSAAAGAAGALLDDDSIVPTQRDAVKHYFQIGDFLFRAENCGK